MEVEGSRRSRSLRSKSEVEAEASRRSGPSSRLRIDVVGRSGSLGGGRVLGSVQCAFGVRARHARRNACAWLRADGAARHTGHCLRARLWGGVPERPAWRWSPGGKGSVRMALRVYGDAVAMCSVMRGMVARIERVDRDLARQLRRAACSVVLNTAEGEHSDAGHARERFRTARGSAAEVRACVDAAVAFGIVTPLATDDARSSTRSSQSSPSSRGSRIDARSSSRGCVAPIHVDQYVGR